MMRYLEYDFLRDHGLQHFDNWVAVFGEQKTDYELKPAGNGFKERTRIANYRNAINCLTDILGMDFKTAVEALTGENISHGVYKPTEQAPPKPRELIIPERAESMRNVFA